MNFKNVYSSYAFSGNPLTVAVPRPTGWSGTNGRYKVMITGDTVFEGRFAPPVEINIADIVDAYNVHLPSLPEGNQEPVVNLADFGELANRTVSFRAEIGSWADEAQVTVLPGGLSKQNLRRYAQEKEDVFSARFLNYAGNFFFSSRRPGWQVIMREMEIAPLYFLTDRPLTMQIGDDIIGAEISIEVDPGFNALDVEAVRRHFFKTEGVLISQFSILVNGKFATKVVIEQSAQRKDLYSLEYRNSLGVFERLEIADDLKFLKGESDTIPVERYDPSTDDKIRQWLRAEIEITASVSTAWLHADEIPALMDLLASDEVNLIIGDSRIPVHVETEELEVDFRPENPQKFNLKVTPAEKDSRMMAAIHNLIEMQKPGVFCDRFNKIFD